jgi:hypothetical protein
MITRCKEFPKIKLGLLLIQTGIAERGLRMGNRSTNPRIFLDISDLPFPTPWRLNDTTRSGNMLRRGFRYAAMPFCSHVHILSTWSNV